jgi:predicted lysophospholipase L1 biosynthesis ABC-type transport system permease subunit
VVVVNETLALRLGGVREAVGQTVKARTSMTSRQVADATVVGVVGDGYERVAWNRRVPVGYRVVDSGTAASGDAMVLKGPRAAEARPAVLKLLGTIHPQLAPWEIGTVADLVDARFSAARLSINALAAMSLAALVLAAVGLFGAMAQSASSRLREFGVRLALGARPADIGRLIVREAAQISGAGLALGLVASTLFAFGVRSGLETMSPFDPVPALAIGVTVLVIAFLAAMTPARRVMAIDPVKTLRGD